MAVYSNRCLVQQEISKPNENLARVAGRSLKKSLGPAGSWLDLTGASPQDTFPVTTGISDKYYSEGFSSASFISSSPKSLATIIFPDGRPTFSPILQMCSSLMHNHPSDVKTLAAEQAFQASLQIVRDTVAASNLQNDSNDSELYEVQLEINILEESDEVHSSEADRDITESH
ncbi:hypothetical protein KR084_008711 [Drosophila pseudotakahashii]|nr:hypothetical protein KR084_008711 [Drosophila pseudotakahashii]